MHRCALPILLILIVFSCGNEQEKIQPSVRPITESVYSSITIQPDSLYQAFAAVQGILDQNLVEEGDEVSKGTPLVQVTNNAPKLNTENARLSLQLAQKNYYGDIPVLQSIEDEIKASALRVKDDSINYYRQRNLWEQNIGSKVIYENKKLAYELSKNTLALLLNKYDRTKEELKTQLQQAQNNYQSSLTNTGDFTISSKIHGKVYALYKNPGELVNMQEPLASVGSINVFVIEMLVDEVDIIKIQKGQKVLITLDAYNGQVFIAKVSKIYPKKDERNQTFTVEELFNDPPSKLYPGLSGEANIIVSQKKEALTIPKAYVIDDHKVQTENELVSISIGLQSLDTVEVISGITRDTWIYKP